MMCGPSINVEKLPNVIAERPQRLHVLLSLQEVSPNQPEKLALILAL